MTQTDLHATVADIGEAPSAPTIVDRFAPVLAGGQRRLYVAGVVLWGLSTIWFWTWWLDPAHVVSLARFALVSVVLAWVTLQPLYFIAIFKRARRPVGELALPEGARVAMVVTKAPSEPFPVVRETLEAMLAQTVPHDTWLADEDPTAEVIAWCSRHGVFLSTRHGRTDYHRATWPRRTRCKEGNLAFFYDNYGYANYDFVAQMDADHVPEPDYLRQMMLPFADPAVGYVSAPSICDKNAAGSWSARGRLHAEASLHGSLQAGYNGGWAPLCIGSHYAVRTSALREIGGLGPELAEDHSTTLMFNAAGWKGVHALDAIAHGDGPSTLGNLTTQEFQWSRSLVTILLRYLPRYIGGLPGGLKFQFVFSELWYPLFSVMMAVMAVMPIAALLSGKVFVNVTYPEFLLHAVPMATILVLLAYRWRATGTFRPIDAPVVSWEAMLFLIARWPWSLLGTAAALQDRLTGSFIDYRVTPKGTRAEAMLPLRQVAPYALISLASVAAVLTVEDPGNAAGFYIFALVNALLYGLLVLVIVVMHMRENGMALWPNAFSLAPRAGIVALLLATSGVGTAWHGLDGVDALTIGAGSFRLTSTTYSVSGAGLGTAGNGIRRFDPHWRTISP